MALVSPYISYIGKEFDTSRIKEYGLTIQISLGGFSFVLHDTGLRQMVALHAYNNIDSPSCVMPALKEFCTDNDIDIIDLKSFVCVVDDANYAIVPTPLFEKGKEKTYLDFCRENKDGLVLSEHVEAADCEVVFGMDKDFSDTLRDMSVHPSIRHSAAIIIEKIIPQNQGLKLYANVRQKDFDIMVARDGKMLFYNSFNFDSTDDFVYYVVAVMRRFGSVEELELQLAGMVMPESEVCSLLKRYVRNVQFVETQVCLPDMLDVPSHCLFVPLSLI